MIISVTAPKIQSEVDGKKVLIQREKPRTLKFEVPFEEAWSVQEFVDAYGEEAIKAAIIDAAVIAAQGVARRLLEQERTDEEVLKEMKTWTLGVSKRRTATLDEVAIQKIAAKLLRLPEAERTKMLESLRAQVQV